MPAATLMLVARGAKEKFLTNQPSFSYWRYAHRKHTPFAMAMTDMTVTGDTSWGGLCKAVLDGRGDLVSDCYITVALPALSVTGPNPQVQWCQKLGHNIIEYVELVIGGETIERHTSQCLELMTQLMMTADKKDLYYDMIGHKGSMINPKQLISPALLYIPLRFAFCQRTGCSLPVLAIQCQDVEIRWRFREAHQVYQTYDPDNVVECGPLENIGFMANYIFLSEPERKMFLNQELNYLVEIIQTNEGTDVGGTRGNSVDLDFTHPVKCLFFACQRSAAVSNEFALEAGFPAYNDYDNFSSSAIPATGSNMVDKLSLYLNGQKLADPEAPQFYNLLQAWKYFSGVPEVGVFCYSFALKPEEFQPSGHADFTRFQTANLHLQFNEKAVLPCVMSVYAWSYNVLTIHLGQAILEYVM